MRMMHVRVAYCRHSSALKAELAMALEAMPSVQSAAVRVRAAAAPVKSLI